MTPSCPKCDADLLTNRGKPNFYFCWTCEINYLQHEDILVNVDELEKIPRGKNEKPMSMWK